MKMFIAIILVLTGISVIAKADDKKENEVSVRMTKPIQLFLQICVISNGQESKVIQQSFKMGFKEAAKEIAAGYLRNKSGRVFITKNKYGSFAISVLKDGLCSLFVHQSRDIDLQASMEAWLPPKSSDYYTYTTEIVSETNALKTTAYTMSKNSTLFERWVITVAKQPFANLKAIMSYNKPR